MVVTRSTFKQQLTLLIFAFKLVQKTRKKKSIKICWLKTKKGSFYWYILCYTPITLFTHISLWCVTYHLYVLSILYTKLTINYAISCWWSLRFFVFLHDYCSALVWVKSRVTLIRQFYFYYNVNAKRKRCDYCESRLTNKIVFMIIFFTTFEIK